jgi:hypothetical protein
MSWNLRVRNCVYLDEYAVLIRKPRHLITSRSAKICDDGPVCVSVPEHKAFVTDGFLVLCPSRVRIDPFCSPVNPHNNCVVPIGPNTFVRIHVFGFVFLADTELGHENPLILEGLM